MMDFTKKELEDLFHALCIAKGEQIPVRLDNDALERLKIKVYDVIVQLDKKETA